MPSVPRTDRERAANSLRGADLLLEFLERQLREHLADLAAVRVAVEQALDHLRRGAR